MMNWVDKVVMGVAFVVVIGLLVLAVFGEITGDVSVSTITTLNNTQTILRML